MGQIATKINRKSQQRAAHQPNMPSQLRHKTVEPRSNESHHVSQTPAPKRGPGLSTRVNCLSNSMLATHSNGSQPPTFVSSPPILSRHVPNSWDLFAEGTFAPRVPTHGILLAEGTVSGCCNSPLLSAFIPPNNVIVNSNQFGNVFNYFFFIFLFIL